MPQPPNRLQFVAPVLRVADLRRSTDYYCARLGFALEFAYQEFYASVVRDGCRVHLKCALPPLRDQQAFEASGHLDACFGVEDVQALSAELANAGADLSVPLREMPYGRELYVRDPDGYILGFIEAKDSL